MEKKWILPVAVALSITAGAAGGAYVSNSENELWGNKQSETEVKPSPLLLTHDDKEWTKLMEAYDLIHEQYVEKVEEEQLIEGAIEGMLSTLNDPYTVYMDKETAKQFDEALDSSFEGIGTEIGMEDKKIIIISPYKDSPAEKAGLKPKDQLLKVDGESIEGLDLYETRLKIRGKKGTSVTIEIKRQGVTEPMTLTIKRDEIPLDTVFSSIKEVADKQIGYIELTSFSKNTSADFKEQLATIEEKGISGLVIDVRGNPGGLLSSVEGILSELIPNDKPILKIEQRSGKTESVFTDLEKKKKYPIAVLTDKGSASASEILAGAMQEAGDYSLIGETTFGKGTVQQAVPMGDGSNIKITLFKWLTPEGNWIHQKGITPNIEVHQPAFFNAQPLTIEKTFKLDMTDEQIKNAQEILLALGFEPGRTDGYYDKQTKKAMKAFQNVHELNASGNLNSKTAAKLEEAVLKKIKDEKNDVQLRTALKFVSK